MLQCYTFDLIWDFRWKLHHFTLKHLYLLFVLGSYSLSVRDLDQNSGEGVKHYRIRNMDNGGFYITAKISFNSLKELVQHHSRTYSNLRELINVTDNCGVFLLKPPLSLSIIQVMQMVCAQSWWSHVSQGHRRSPGGRMSGRFPVNPWSWSASLEQDSLEKFGWVSTKIKDKKEEEAMVMGLAKEYL